MSYINSLLPLSISALCGVMFFCVSFSYDCGLPCLSLLRFSMFYQATALTRRWLLAPLWALVARVCGRREADLLEAVLIGGDGGDNGGGGNGGGGNGGGVLAGGAHGGGGAPARPEGQAAEARLAAQRQNAPTVAPAQPSTSRAAIGAERPSQESQAAQLAVGELLVAARRAEVSFSCCSYLILSILAVPAFDGGICKIVESKSTEK
jgi:hypothetical protein